MGSLSPSLWVIGLPFVGAAVVTIAGSKREKLVPGIAVLFGLLGAAFAALMIRDMAGGKTLVTVRGLGLPVVSDGLGAFMAGTASVIGALVLIYSVAYMAHEHGKSKYYALVLLVIGAMSGQSLSGNLLWLCAFWEICEAAGLSLIGFNKDDPKAVAGARKGLLMSVIADIGLFGGTMVLYAATVPHTFDIATIISKAADGTIPHGALTAAAFLMLVGAIGKSAQIPMQVWLPDVMESPSSASALIDAATMVNGGAFLLAKMYPAFKEVPGWAVTVMWVGATTLILAALEALAARHLKKMLAYSTMSQIGYMFFALGSGGVLASQFHLVSHAVFKALLFMAAGAVIHETGTKDIAEMSGVGKKMPITGVLFLFGVMGLSGIPLFSGFFSKDMILATALEHKAYLPLGIAVLGAITTFTYSWRSYLSVFGGSVSPAASRAHEAHPLMLVPMAVLAVGTFTSWLLIGVQSGGVAVSTGHHVHAVSVGDLVQETLASPALYLSLLASFVGVLLVANRTRIFSWLERRAPGFMRASSEGFYFDTVYSALVHRLFSKFPRLVERYDKDSEILGHAVGGTGTSGARRLGHRQTGGSRGPNRG